jgi:hypothetical protein
MERRDLYQDDLTEERYPSPASRDDQAATQVLDPDTLPQDTGVPGEPETGDDDEDDEEDDEDEDDES